MNKVKAILPPFFVTLIGSVMMILLLVLPYASVKDVYAERLTKYKDEMHVEEIGMTNAEAVNLSLIEYTQLYTEAMRQGYQKDICIVCIVLICAFAGFGILTFLMTLFKKPIGVILFDLFAMVVFWLFHFEFEDRGVLPSNSYSWGIVNYVAYPIGVMVLAGAVVCDAINDSKKHSRYICSNCERVYKSCTYIKIQVHDFLMLHAYGR